MDVEYRLSALILLLQLVLVLTLKRSLLTNVAMTPLEDKHELHSVSGASLLYPEGVGMISNNLKRTSALACYLFLDLPADLVAVTEDDV